MNFYLDIDGTLISKNHQPARNLEQFLTSLLGSGDVYWLTTHCRDGSSAAALNYLAPLLDQATRGLLEDIKPTRWQTLKTEAIDPTQPFIWFDDFLLEVEKEWLREHQCFDRWVEVDLRANSDLVSYYRDWAGWANISQE